MKFTLQYLTLSIFTLLTCVVSFGQNACSGKLADAKILFESGQIEEIPSILDSCMHNGFSRDEKIQAYRLLIQVYLFDYNPSKANAVMDQMLHEIKYYKIQPTDPVEFIELYNTYKMYSTWAIGITTQINLSSIHLIKNYSITSTNNARKTYQTDEPGWNAGLTFNRYLSNKLWITANLTYQTMNYTSKEWLTSKNDESLVFKEKNQSVSFPLMLNFGILNKKVTPYAFAGAEVSYLLHSKGTVTPSLTTDYSYSGNVTNSRNNLNTAATAGIGLSVKTSTSLFLFSFGYNYNITSYTKASSRYTDLESILTTQHVDDNFKLNKFTLSVSYSHLFYRIKKKQVK